MSKSNVPISPERLHFDLGYRLHFGAINLLLTSSDQLKQAGLLTKKDEERINSFARFFASILQRGVSRFWLEDKSDESVSEDK